MFNRVILEAIFLLRWLYILVPTLVPYNSQSNQIDDLVRRHKDSSNSNNKLIFDARRSYHGPKYPDLIYTPRLSSCIFGGLIWPYIKNPVEKRMKIWRHYMLSELISPAKILNIRKWFRFQIFFKWIKIVFDVIESSFHLEVLLYLPFWPVVDHVGFFFGNDSVFQSFRTFTFELITDMNCGQRNLLNDYRYNFVENIFLKLTQDLAVLGSPDSRIQVKNQSSNIKSFQN